MIKGCLPAILAGSFFVSVTAIAEDQRVCSPSSNQRWAYIDNIPLHFDAGGDDKTVACEHAKAKRLDWYKKSSEAKKKGFQRWDRDHYLEFDISGSQCDCVKEPPDRYHVQTHFLCSVRLRSTVCKK